MRRRFLPGIFFLFIAIWVACGQAATPTPTPTATPAPTATPMPRATPASVISSTTTASGLQIRVLAEGTGEPARVGATVSVHYTGWLVDGTKFDSSLDRGEPFQFALGQGRVIQGWDEGVATMKVGDKVLVISQPEDHCRRGRHQAWRL